MSNLALRRLTKQQVDSYRINGHITVENVLSTQEVEVLADHTDRIAEGQVKNIPETSTQLEKVYRDGDLEVTNQLLSVRKLFNIAVYDNVMWGHVTNTAIVDIVADLLSTDDIKLYGDQLFMKPPELGAEQPWHQDSESWRDIFPMDLVSAWTAIDHATTENGCLNFAPGTQRCGMLRGQQREAFVRDLGNEEWPIVAAPLRPGSISFHHSLVLHQSNANTSGQRRRGYAVHYMRAKSYRDDSITDAPKMPAFKQVRGQSFPTRV